MLLRSSYPRVFRKFMSEVLIEILRGDTETQLTDKAHQFKKDLKLTWMLASIAKAGAVKNLNKYKPKGKQSSLFQFQKGTPAHGKAATYNQLLSHFKVEMKYEPLKGGDKIKWVYLKQNPFGLDAVAFNGYNDPKEIMDIVTTYIDYDKIFERELLKKLEDFYELWVGGKVLSSTKT